MKLSEVQREFAKTWAQFSLWIYSQPERSFTYGEAYRTPEQAQLNADAGIGIANSVHCKRLAIDINLFLDGELTWNVEDYRELGEKWKTMHPLARWGGDFKGKSGRPRPDAVHFSFEWEGVK
jgi:hypothetical protein